MDSIWSKFRRDSQYQLEEVQDWASHLEHLQSILLEFDADGAPEESDLIRFFQEGFKPSIKAQMEQRGRELDSWEELVEKVAKAESKAGLQPTPFIREMDQQCPRGNCPAHATVARAQTKGLSMRDPRIEEPKARPQPTAPQRYIYIYSLYEAKKVFKISIQNQAGDGIHGPKLHDILNLTENRRLIV